MVDLERERDIDHGLFFCFQKHAISLFGRFIDRRDRIDFCIKGQPYRGDLNPHVQKATGV